MAHNRVRRTIAKNGWFKKAPMPEHLFEHNRPRVMLFRAALDQRLADWIAGPWHYSVEDFNDWKETKMMVSTYPDSSCSVALVARDNFQFLCNYAEFPPELVLREFYHVKRAHDQNSMEMLYSLERDT